MNDPNQEVSEALRHLNQQGLVEIAWSEDDNNFVFWMEDWQVSAFKETDDYNGEWE